MAEAEGRMEIWRLRLYEMEFQISWRVSTETARYLIGCPCTAYKQDLYPVYYGFVFCSDNPMWLPANKANARRCLCCVHHILEVCDIAGDRFNSNHVPYLFN